MITARQMRAARGLLGWDAADLAERAGAARETISRIESNQVRPHERTQLKIRRVFDEQGVEFLPHDGVRMKSQDVEVMEGPLGLLRLYELIYDYIGTYGGLVSCCGVEESIFEPFQQGFAAEHKRRLGVLRDQREDFEVRHLVREASPITLESAGVTVRALPNAFLVLSPFYVFGDQLALLTMGHDPAPLFVFVRSASMVASYKRAFDAAWASAGGTVS